jgi:hypothetical protein
MWMAAPMAPLCELMVDSLMEKLKADLMAQESVTTLVGCFFAF